MRLDLRLRLQHARLELGFRCRALASMSLILIVFGVVNGVSIRATALAIIDLAMSPAI